MKLALKLGAAFLVSVFLGLGSVYWFLEKSDFSGAGGIAVWVGAQRSTFHQIRQVLQIL